MSRAPSWLTERPVAHRGFHDAAAGRIENSRSAVAAIARDFAVEVDLRLSADGAVVVFHDGRLDRLCGIAGRVDALRLADLIALPLGGGPDRIWPLADLLALVAGRVPLLLELKGEGRRDGVLECRVAVALASYRGPAAIMSFDPWSVDRFRRLSPTVPRGLVADRSTKGTGSGRRAITRFLARHLAAVPLVRPHFVAYDIRALPAVAPALVRRLGLPLLTWTVRTAAERAAAARHADQIIFEGFDPSLP